MLSGKTWKDNSDSPYTRFQITQENFDRFSRDKCI